MRMDAKKINNQHQNNDRTPFTFYTPGSRRAALNSHFNRCIHFKYHKKNQTNQPKTIRYRDELTEYKDINPRTATKLHTRRQTKSH